jgi:sulfite exporter TauE/SafE/copper chaperone CopZ/plastocyanin
MDKNKKEHIYYVEGMHCASCEVLIEKKLLELENIKLAKASTSKGEVLIEYNNEKPTIHKLNEIFKKEGYVFFEEPPQTKIKGFKKEDFLVALGTALLIIFIFVTLNKFGLSGLININSKSSLLTIFLFGIMAGFSSCSALVGGIILSMSKKWNELYSFKESNFKKFQPHLFFNLGRLISYGFFGGVLGIIGSKINFSLEFGSVLVIAVSIIMIFLAFEMLGIRAFRKFQFSAPRFITRFITNESNFKGYYMPFLMGAFTFFLPCGFTLTAQGLALISGSAIYGSLIMFLFALGTLPMLLFIGFSSIKFYQKPNLTNKFLKAAGILVLFFAFYNINLQLNVLGISNFSDLNFNFINLSNNSKNNYSQNEEGLAPIVDGKQILKMDASSYGYSPNYFKVRALMPVRWEITDKGTSGCTNAIIARDLFEGQIALTPGKTSIKEFTPQRPGKYKFSCWMGMVSGVIEVVDNNLSSWGYSNKVLNNNENLFISQSINSNYSCGANRSCGCLIR